jgi:predicted ABC-type ATPase
VTGGVRTDPERYLLSPEEHERIFREDIAPDLTADLVGHSVPRAIVLGGQPGAGKSALQSVAEQELASRGGVLSVVGDDLRAYHPLYEELLARDDKTAAFYTDRDSGRWVEKLIAHAKSLRLDLVIEGTMRVPDKVASTLRELRAAGYSTEVRVIAVRAEFSRLGIRQRYEQLLLDRGHARFTTAKAHDAAYHGSPMTIALLEQERLADIVRVCARGNVGLYTNRLVDDRWERVPMARVVLERERTRGWTGEEKAEYARGWDTVWRRMVARGASHGELESVRNERERSLTVMRADPRALAVFQKLVEPAKFQEIELLARSIDRGRGR